MKVPFWFPLVAGLLIGCVSVGRKIDPAAASQIKPGITTEQEIIALLGQPSTRGSHSDGRTVLGYSHVKAAAKPTAFIPVVGMFAGGATGTSNMLTIALTNGVVESVNHIESVTDMK